jgi:hypothetical protein
VTSNSAAMPPAMMYFVRFFFGVRGMSIGCGWCCWMIAW